MSNMKYEINRGGPHSCGITENILMQCSPVSVQVSLAFLWCLSYTSEQHVEEMSTWPARHEQPNIYNFINL